MEHFRQRATATGLSKNAASLERGGEAHSRLTIAPGQSGLADVVHGKLIRLMPLWQM